MNFLRFTGLYRKNFEAVADVTRGPSERYLGFTLIEWLVVLALVGTLFAVAVPAYTGYIDRANNAQAKTDIRTLEQHIAKYEIKNDALPDSLDDIDMGGFPDPWGNPYQYLRIDGAGLEGKGDVRKDKKLNPINSDYDLYSMGKDGESRQPLTAKVSHDDIVRANNGAFLGLAIDY